MNTAIAQYAKFVRKGSQKTGNFRHAVMRSVYGYGCETPSSSLQPPLLRQLSAGGSCVVKARRGVGRTGAVLVAFLQQLAEWDRAQTEARTFQLCWRFGGSESGLRVLVRDVVGLISRAIFDRRRRPRML